MFLWFFLLLITIFNFWGFAEYKRTFFFLGWSSSSSQSVGLSKSTKSNESSSSTFSSSERGIKPGSMVTEKRAKTILKEHWDLCRVKSALGRTVTCSRWRWWAICCRDIFCPSMTQWFWWWSCGVSFTFIIIRKNCCGFTQLTVYMWAI